MSSYCLQNRILGLYNLSSQGKDFILSPRRWTLEEAFSIIATKFLALRDAGEVRAIAVQGNQSEKQRQAIFDTQWQSRNLHSGVTEKTRNTLRPYMVGLSSQVPQNICL